MAELTLREVASLLGMPEATVYRWAREGKLPCYQVQEQFRFNRIELHEWAMTHDYRVSPELFSDHAFGTAAAPNRPGSRTALLALPNLQQALTRGGLFYDLPGSNAAEVLQAVSELPAIPKSIDRKLLWRLLLGRESLGSTGIGHGIAIPHPREPLVSQVEGPTVILAFLRQPVDFAAIDNQKVRILFVLLSPSVRLHLQTLSKLVYLLYDARLKQLLEQAAPATQILECITALEAELLAGAS